VTKRLSGIP